MGQKIPIEESKSILQTQAIAKELKQEYWDRWNETKFTILLIDDEYEFLIGHPNPSLFSTLTYFDSLFQQTIHYRKRSFPLGMAASFPLVDINPVIVMGNIKNSSYNEARWKWTLLHEHFHQLQYTTPEYYNASKNLGLSKDSNDGMWMLNFPFPYQDERVGKAIDEMCRALFLSIEEEDVSKRKLDYKRKKEALKKIISPKDYKYLNFQIWQEGFARFFEIELLKKWNIKNPSKENEKLLASYMHEIKGDLINPNITKKSRLIFYSLGAAEWLLITKSNPTWQDSYFTRLFESDYLLNSK